MVPAPMSMSSTPPCFSASVATAQAAACEARMKSRSIMLMAFTMPTRRRRLASSIVTRQKRTSSRRPVMPTGLTTGRLSRIVGWRMERMVARPAGGSSRLAEATASNRSWRVTRPSAAGTEMIPFTRSPSAAGPDMER